MKDKKKRLSPSMVRIAGCFSLKGTASDILRKYYIMCLTHAFWTNHSDLVMNYELECPSVTGVLNTYDRVQKGTTKRKASTVVLTIGLVLLVVQTSKNESPHHNPDWHIHE